ncbi:hypothetical protein HMPREF9406_1733 [Clostridium sp. HGF2]|nr:hypothetical protein HMPREF9406_1733 [Clostridium sp. HGF2]EQJ53581.1 hypothetical protein QSI_3536 [Clostridioides difficile P28]
MLQYIKPRGGPDMNIHHISIYQKGPHLKSRHSFHLYII